MQSAVQYLKVNSEVEIAYSKLLGKEPGVIFCCGFMSDMNGIKARFIENYCEEKGLACVRFDYRAHGLSKGNLAEANISAWLEDSLAVLDNLTQGPQILVGSSMGAWIATLIAKARPERIKQLIGIAAAPDFTEYYINARLTDEMRERLLNDEILYFPSRFSDKPYAITKQFIDDGRKNSILHAPIEIHCPVQLIHGMQDKDIPWHISMQLVEQIQSSDIKLCLIKDGDHRLVREQDLILLKQTLNNF